MKCAYLIIGELRLIRDKLPKLYKLLFDYYDLDIFIQVQKVSDKDYEDVKLFKKRVVYAEVYDKPDPRDFFRDEMIYSYPNDNWNIDSCLQYYINMRKMSNIIQQHFHKYDYFIIHRVDVDILYPPPPLSLLENQPPSVYAFDPDYSRKWGGYGVGFFIHRDFIIEYLNAPFNVIKDKSLLNIFLKRKKNLNQEFFLVYCYETRGIHLKKINNINMYFTCESLDSRTTYGIQHIHREYKVICKYSKQCTEVYEAAKKWQNGYRWVLNNENIYLEKK